MISQQEIVWRLILSCALAGLIGLERESLQRPAGFRTHVLVCTGSALIMMVSIYAFGDFTALPNRDPARIAAQVVSGIGFLGAGTILREGATVKGLTTAASLWVVAGIGLAIGSGFYFAGVATTFLVFFVLVTFSRIERKAFFKGSYYLLHINIDERPGQLGRVCSALGEKNVTIKNITLYQTNDPAKMIVDLYVKLPPRLDIGILASVLSDIEGVNALEVEG